jgi:integration host factor subunit alpha
MPMPEREEADHASFRTGRQGMMKADFVTGLRKQEGVSSREAVAAVEGTLAVLKEALQKGEPVQLANCGTFTVRAKAERVGRHSATGGWLMIAPRTVVTFRPSRLFRDLMDQGETPEGTETRFIQVDGGKSPCSSPAPFTACAMARRKWHFRSSGNT